MTTCDHYQTIEEKRLRLAADYFPLSGHLKTLKPPPCLFWIDIRSTLACYVCTQLFGLQVIRICVL